MSKSPHPSLSIRPSLSFVLLCAFVSVLWLAGGASRPDAPGQSVVRLASGLALVCIALFSHRVVLNANRAVAWFILAAVALAATQLIPLPPYLWTALPGRMAIEQAALIAGQAQPWRASSLSPGATINALFSLIVPITFWMLISNLKDQERHWVPGLLLCAAVAAAVLSLAQFSNAIDNPLVNETPGIVSGPFANRNHFALFLACAILLVPAWLFLGGRRPRWRAPVGLGLVILFPLTILATGSRAGIVFGVVGLMLGLFISRRRIRREMERYPRWVSLMLVGGALAAVALSVGVSVLADRAVSVDRAFSMDVSQDMRARGLSTVLGGIQHYFPIGAGLGTFDTVFRMREPFDLLKPTYFNHAHNDYLEVALDAGAAGVVLVGAAFIWWAWRSLLVWRPQQEHDLTLARLGSGLILLIFLASIFDYPARTPIIMAVLVVAGTWLGERPESALPAKNQHL